jgi:hypothetical protein
MLLEHQALVDPIGVAARSTPMLLRRQGRENSRNPLS